MQETARALFGADPKQSGKISIMGKDGQLHEVTINSPQDAVKYGIGYLSEDRRRYGVVVQKSVTENTTLATMENFTNGLFINKAKEKEVTEKMQKLADSYKKIDEFDLPNEQFYIFPEVYELSKNANGICFEVGSVSVDEMKSRTMQQAKDIIKDLKEEKQ